MGSPELTVWLGDLAPYAPAIERDTSATWAASGAMALTGSVDGPPLIAPGNPAGAAAMLLGVWSHAFDDRPESPGIGVLSERAAIADLGRRGTTSCGGAARILAAADGHVVFSLARPEDIELIPALVAGPIAGDPWDAVAQWLATMTAEVAVARARELGLPAAVVPLARPARGRSAAIAHRGPAKSRRARPRVLDLTSLWAGPLAARLLGLAGADVVKVESTTRPDGARRGPGAFFDLLHSGHRSVALDFADTSDRTLLLQLARSADIVLEASRPRALRQLGLDAENIVAGGVTWVSITAYGRDVDDGMRIGFGDDVAVSGGLFSGDASDPMFCGDALADPLSGLTAAAAAAVAWTTPHSWLIDVSMHDVCRVAAELPQPTDAGGPVKEPSFSPALRSAPALGQHTADVIGEWLA